MIGFMPDFYPDELVYSLLARYYQRSGYLAYIHAAKDLYTVPTIRPDMYFINPMRDEAWERITRETGTDAVILEHTMVPAYARFLPVDARQQALQQMSRMEGRPYMMLKVTHELDAIKYSCKRMAVLEDGVITEQGDVHDIFYNSQSRTGALFSKVFFEMQQAGEVKNGEGI